LAPTARAVTSWPRTIYGGQISIIIGLCAVVVSAIVGVLVGSIAGYYGGPVDAVLMRFTEAMFNIPQLFLLILLSKLLSGKVSTFKVLGRTFSGSVVVIIVVIGLTSWMYLARIVRATYLSLKEQEFVTAARCIGTRNASIIFRHILPNSMASVIVSATLGVAAAILNEAYVSFLGVGVQAPTATWGNMLDQAYHHLESEPWMWIFPGLFILLTVLSINFLGDGLRDALDPRTDKGDAVRWAKVSDRAPKPHRLRSGDLAELSMPRPPARWRNRGPEACARYFLLTGICTSVT